MDTQTINAYEQHGADFAKRYRAITRVSTERYKAAFGYRARILDIGAGSGVDMAHLLESGYDVIGIEPSATLRRETLEHFPQLHARLHDAAMPLSEEHLKKWHRRFEGIMCSAVFMHLNKDEQKRAIHNIYDLLKPEGRLMLTVSATRNGLDDQRRDEFGRYYAELSKERVHSLCESAGLSIVEIWNTDDQWQRSDISWSTYLAEKTSTK